MLARLLLLALGLGLLGIALFHLLRWRGLILLPQEADPRQWEVFGVDVSVYQGEVDWPALAAQGVDFAFIKATEGSSLQDVRFRENWVGAQAAGVRTGAYHFFSYDSPGETQADNFIDAVPADPGALPPVVDIEFYGDNLEDPPDKAHVHAILDPLREGYEDYPLWVSSPMVAPLGKDWSFWQYSHSARLEGYQGAEQRIDLNVFRGSAEEFRRFGLRG